MKSPEFELHNISSYEKVQKYQDLIYDVGLHKGEDTDFYLRKGFRVIAFEADPDLSQQCKIRFREAIDSGKLVIIEGAILDANTIATKNTVQFFKNDKNSVWGTVNANWADRNAKFGCPSKVLEIATVDFVATLKKYGIPHYLKVDIEGCDMICINALKVFENRPDFVSIETDTSSFRNFKHEIETLADLGYGYFQMVEQSIVPNQAVPNPPKEGNYVPYHFEEGCTGLFGLELGGEWHMKCAIFRKFRMILLIFFIMRTMTSWKFRGARFLRAKVGRLLSWLAKSSAWGWYDTHARYLPPSNL
jgi:FkbM family methyltransferase